MAFDVNTVGRQGQTWGHSQRQCLEYQRIARAPQVQRIPVCRGDDGQRAEPYCAGAQFSLQSLAFGRPVLAQMPDIGRLSTACYRNCEKLAILCRNFLHLYRTGAQYSAYSVDY